MLDRKARLALDKLVRLAREDCADLREDLADIASARLATEASLGRLDGGEAGAARDWMRRQSLAASLATLEDAEAAARDKLETTTSLIIRLEADLARQALGAKTYQNQSVAAG